MISHLVVVPSQKEIDCAFDKLPPDLRRRYYYYRYAPPLAKALMVQRVQVIRNGDVVFDMDTRGRHLMVPFLRCSPDECAIEEIVLNDEMVYLRVDGVELLNRFTP